MTLQYIRSVLFSFIALPIWTLFICIGGSPALLLPRKTFMHLIHIWARGVTLMEKSILGLHFEVRGLEHLPENQHCIVASKHQSTYETFKVHELFNDGAVILKKELFRIPFWGLFLMKSGVIAIDRSTPKEAIKSVNEGSRRVAAEGRTIVIYPQGTRVTPKTTPEEVSYKQGVYRVYEETKLPVIPLATNSGCYWPKGALLKRSGTVVFEFLPPIEAENMDRSTFMQAVQKQIEDRSNALAAEANKDIG